MYCVSYREGWLDTLRHPSLCVYDVFYTVRNTVYVCGVSYREGCVCAETPLPVRYTLCTYDVAYREGCVDIDTLS